MRKTQLWFTKEASPEYYNPKVTYVGRANTINPIKKQSTQNRAKRFPQYELEEKRLGRELGPGYYPQFYKTINASPAKGTPLYKRFYRQRDLTDNWYFSINEPSHSPPKRMTF